MPFTIADRDSCSRWNIPADARRSVRNEMMGEIREELRMLLREELRTVIREETQSALVAHDKRQGAAVCH